LRIPLVLSVSHYSTTNGSQCATDGGAFQSAAALMADDAAGRGTPEGSNDGAGLGIRAAA
jgi:hypothetical protein